MCNFMRSLGLLLNLSVVAVEFQELIGPVQLCCIFNFCSMWHVEAVISLCITFGRSRVFLQGVLLFHPSPDCDVNCMKFYSILTGNYMCCYDI